MLDAVMKLLHRLGLTSGKKVLTDQDRRTIITMLDAGMEPTDLTAITGYTREDIDCARASDVFTGQPISAASALASSPKSER